MRKRLSFQERWRKEENNFKIMQRFVVSFIAPVFLLILASWIVYGINVYQVVGNPEGEEKIFFSSSY